MSTVEAARTPRHTMAFVAAALLVAAVVRLGAEPPLEWQVVALAVLVGLVGLPHGALDPVVARDAGLVTGSHSMRRYLVGYVLLAAATAVAWVVLPAVVLPAFLLVSALHFGGDWPRLPAICRTLAGVGVVFAPLAFHPDAAADVLEPLADPATAERLVDVGRALGPVAMIAALALAIGHRERRAAIEIATLAVLAWALPPLAYFVVYFCGLHSPRHIAGVLERTATARSTSLRTAVVFTGVALLGAAVVGIVQARTPSAPSEDTLRIVFIGLAALTVPHMVTLARADRADRTGTAEMRDRLPSAR